MECLNDLLATLSVHCHQMRNEMNLHVLLINEPPNILHTTIKCDIDTALLIENRIFFFLKNNRIFGRYQMEFRPKYDEIRKPLVNFQVIARKMKKQ